MGDTGGIAVSAVIFWIVLGYLSGSIPFGLLLAKFAGLGDVRSIGSGNIGATNVLRTGSKKAAIATLACDMLKGAVPVLLARYISGEQAAVFSGTAAFFGHVLPIWLKFKGGKGVATYLGVLFALWWPLALVFMGVWLGLAAIFRYSSVSSLWASAAMPVVALLMSKIHIVLPTIIIGVVIFIAHKGNIARLLRGEESRIKLSKSKANQ